ncbi:MAG: hypothetical protein JWR38_2831 [Mucilaginibacter sp.]|nr:hypothetical protein [Mucilaginibacter sp.]
MKRTLILVSWLLLITGCGIRRFYTYTHWEGDVENYKPQKIELDTSYQLYIRQVGKSKSDYIVQRDNYEEIAGDGKEKIEVEYLLFSQKSKRVLYLTTIPPFFTGDKDHRWIYDEPVFNNSNYVNIWFLNLFYIGKYNETQRTFEFMRKDQQVIDTWTYQFNTDQSILLVNTITDNIPVELQHFEIARPDTTFSFPLKFHRQKNFQLGINGHWHDADFTEGVTLQGDFKVLYYAVNGNKVDIFFNIGKDPKDLAKKKDPATLKDDWVHFYNIRVKYKP